LLAFNKISSSPAGEIHSVTPAESSNAESEHAIPLDADAVSHHQTSSPTQRRNGLRRTVRGLLKPLIAVARTQYVLVTALAAFAAFMVASEAGKTINAKLEPIIAALKRL
jgi:hypothetical protein